MIGFFENLVIFVSGDNDGRKALAMVNFKDLSLAIKIRSGQLKLLVLPRINEFLESDLVSLKPAGRFGIGKADDGAGKGEVGEFDFQGFANGYALAVEEDFIFGDFGFVDNQVDVSIVDRAFSVGGKSGIDVFGNDFSRGLV